MGLFDFFRNDDNEKGIARLFISARDIEEKREIVEQLPSDLRIRRIMKYLLTVGDKRSFMILYYLKNKNRKALKTAIDHFKEANGSYASIKDVLNLLRHLGEYDLIRQALTGALKKRKGQQDFYQNMISAQDLGNNLSAEGHNGVARLLEKNSSRIKNNTLVYSNIEDMFEYDRKLKHSKEAFTLFAAKEKVRPALQEDNEEENEEKDGADIPEEKTPEETIELSNYSKALIEIFNAISVTEAKIEFLHYIRDVESVNITPADVNALVARVAEYRQLILPARWKEIDRALSGTKKISFFYAWYKALYNPGGKYNQLIATIKEYIVKNLIQIMLRQLAESVQLTDKNTYIQLIEKLELKKIDIEEIKKLLSSFFKNADIIAIEGTNHIKMLKLLAKYYFSLHSQLSVEKELIHTLILDLAKENSITGKAAILTRTDKEKIEPISDDILKEHLHIILDKWSFFYSLLLEDVKKVEDENENETDILKKFQAEVARQGNVKNFRQKLNYLSFEEGLKVIASLGFDPRFDEHYIDIKAYCDEKRGGRIIGLVLDKARAIEKEYGIGASEEYMDDLFTRLENEGRENRFLLYHVKNLKENMIKIHNEQRRGLEGLNKELAHCRNVTEKLFVLQRFSKDPLFKGVYGTIHRMQQIFLRENLGSVISQVSQLPPDTQKALLKGLYGDLKIAFMDEPELILEVEKHLNSLEAKMKNKKEIKAKADEDFMALQEISIENVTGEKENGENETAAVTLPKKKKSEIHEKYQDKRKVIRRIEQEIDKISGVNDRIARLELLKIEEYNLPGDEHIRAIIDGYIDDFSKNATMDTEQLWQILLEELKKSTDKEDFLTRKLSDPRYYKLRLRIGKALARLQDLKRNTKK